MRRVSMISAIALLTGTCGTALAADFGNMEEAQPMYSWSGVYFGIDAGGGWGDVDLTENLPFLLGVPIPPSLNSSHEIDGGIAGVHLGMNRQIGNWVLGGEVGLNGADISGSGGDCLGLETLINPLIGAASISTTCDTNVNWLATALAKVGYAHDRWMIYGTAGWAVAGVDHRFTLDVNIPGPGLVLSLSSAQQDTADGLAIGAGAEYAMSDAVSFGVEYLHTELESRGEGLLLGGLLTTGDRDIDLDIIRARLNVKWGG